jgi:hypothetical protein
MRSVAVPFLVWLVPFHLVSSLRSVRSFSFWARERGGARFALVVAAVAFHTLVSWVGRRTVGGCGLRRVVGSETGAGAGARGEGGRMSIHRPHAGLRDDSHGAAALGNNTRMAYRAARPCGSLSSFGLLLVSRWCSCLPAVLACRPRVLVRWVVFDHTGTRRVVVGALYAIWLVQAWQHRRRRARRRRGRRRRRTEGREGGRPSSSGKTD